MLLACYLDCLRYALLQVPRLSEVEKETLFADELSLALLETQVRSVCVWAWHPMTVAVVFGVCDWLFAWLVLTLLLWLFFAVAAIG